MNTKTSTTKIEPSEHWNGFSFAFSNGWNVSLQQGSAHYCTEGKTMEVAIFDPQGKWWGYDEENGELFLPKADTYVNGHLDADDVARVIALVGCPLELDTEAKA
jgi:hypothetical protein